jgi:hypothetical protein
MRTIEEQHKLLEELLSQARQRMNAGETEWIEFKTNIGESRCSITYEGVELLWNKLPEALNDKQKENKITNLLASLRRAGKIMQGEKRQWVLRLL